MRSDPSLATVPDVPTLAKNYLEAKRFSGIGEKVAKPQKSWEPGGKEYTEFYNALGRPEAPEKYPTPEVQLEAGVTVDENLMKAARENFHKLGLSDVQFKGVLEYYLNSVNGQVKAEKDSTIAAQRQADEALRKEWGQKYEMNSELARVAFAKYADPEFIQYATEKGLANNPQFIKAWAKIGAGMSEDSATGRGTHNILPTKIQAQREIDAMMGDKEFMDKYYGGDKGARARWDELHRVAHV
jgi:hypothetical protein